MAEALRQVLVHDGPEAVETARLPGVAASPAGSGAGWPIEARTLEVLEQKLANYVGPIARFMVRTAAGRASSLESLCERLAVSVSEGAERERFRRDVASLMRTRPPAPDVSSPAVTGWPCQSLS